MVSLSPPLQTSSQIYLPLMLRLYGHTNSWNTFWCYHNCLKFLLSLSYFFLYQSFDIFFSDVPKNISALVIPSSSVLEGSSVTLICSSDANPAVNYTWSRESEEQLEQLQTGETLTFNRTDPTHSGRYHCTAQNQHGSHNSSVMLDIQCEYNKTTNFTSSHSLAPKSQS